MKKSIIIVIASTIILIGIIIPLIKFISTVKNDEATSSNHSFAPYDDLFVDSATTTITATVKSNHREPESTYSYNSNYNIFVYRVAFKHSSPDKGFVTISKGNSNKRNSEVYTGVPSSTFEMFKKQGVTGYITTVNVKLDGTSIETPRPNDIYTYLFKAKSLSIRFDNNPYDVVANSSSYSAMNLALIRKNNFLYIIIMTAKEKVEMGTDQLYNILKK